MSTRCKGTFFSYFTIKVGISEKSSHVLKAVKALPVFNSNHRTVFCEMKRFNFVERKTVGVHIWYREPSARCLCAGSKQVWFTEEVMERSSVKSSLGSKAGQLMDLCCSWSGNSIRLVIMTNVLFSELILFFTKHTVDILIPFS